jgi:hypothetical protein
MSNWIKFLSFFFGFQLCVLDIYDVVEVEKKVKTFVWKKELERCTQKSRIQMRWTRRLEIVGRLQEMRYCEH